MSTQGPGEGEEHGVPHERPPSLGGLAASTPPARYRPLLLLGHGGMGSVEAVAEELEDGTTRVVALKRILRTATTDASRLEMFLREARLTTLLDHPNVVRSLAYGESAGEVFLAMEYIAGEPLSHVIATARERGEVLPVSLIAFILAQASEGLHAAHELRGPDGEWLGVVHRDVSPHNVMVGYDGTVRLLDFGVAKMSLVDSTSRTKTGEVKGKTAYMSPEQAMGDEVDRRSDLYSMGAVLFECLTGKRMWGNGTDFDVLRRLALEDAPRLAEVMPEAPAGLAALHAQLIEREPARRPATAEVLAARLREYVESDGDAAAVRGMMARLFDGERARRERALADALGSTEPIVLHGDAARASAERSARVARGESTPAFVTHRGAGSSSTARRSGLVAATAAIAAILGGTFGLAYRGAPARSDPRTTGAEASRESPESTPAAASSAVAPAVVPTTARRGNLEAPSVAASATSVSSARFAPKGAPAIVRHLATPRAATPSVPASARSAVVVPPPAPKAPEPPDVDPTPF